jgi:hypothetical protein
LWGRLRGSTGFVASQQVEARGAPGRIQPEPPVAIAGDFEDDRVRGRGPGTAEMPAREERPQLVDQVVEGDRV